MANEIVHDKEEVWIYHKTEGNPRKGWLARRNIRLARRNVRGDVSVAQELDSHPDRLPHCHKWVTHINAMQPDIVGRQRKLVKEERVEDFGLMA